MAITHQMANLILLEHLHKPITGEVLLLGRQTVFMTPEQAKELVTKLGIVIRPDARIEYDTTTWGRQQNFISDVSFFSLFSDATVVACDVSNYEGADFIFDLSAELPASVLGKFNFIYNGSVLDNVFDPAACVRNISRMLKPDGRVFHYEGLKHVGMTYLKFTPEWFFDYYAVNGFSDCQVYLLAYHDYFGKYWVVEWNAYVKQQTEWKPTPVMRFAGEAMVVAIIQNGPSAQIDRMPIQNTYRSNEAEYVASFMRYTQSVRRQSIRGSLSMQNPSPSQKKVAPKSIKEFLRWGFSSRQQKNNHQISELLPYEQTEAHEVVGWIN